LVRTVFTMKYESKRRPGATRSRSVTSKRSSAHRAGATSMYERSITRRSGLPAPKVRPSRGNWMSKKPQS
jgi:hypothetical protein